MPEDLEARLREQMRDARYWNGSAPGSAEFRARVSEGWRQLVAAEDPSSDDVEGPRVHPDRQR